MARYYCDINVPNGWTPTGMIRSPKRHEYFVDATGKVKRAGETRPELLVIIVQPLSLRILQEWEASPGVIKDDSEER